MEIRDRHTSRKKAGEQSKMTITKRCETKPPGAEWCGLKIRTSLDLPKMILPFGYQNVAKLDYTSHEGVD